MKKDKLIIILSTLVIVILIIIFIFYGSKMISFFANNTNSKDKITRVDPGMILIQLQDAENELKSLQEVSYNQQESAKIEVLLEKIGEYQEEFKKPVKEITQQEIDNFYNSNLWQSIADLKSEASQNGQDKETVPELE